jgi:type I restriction enzyme S subunit
MPDCQYIGLEHVESHTNKLLATVPAKTMSSSSALFFAGDILYGRMRPYLNKVVLPEFDGLASAEFIVLPQVPGVYSRYILRFLSSSKFVEFACSQYDGDRPRVKYEQLAKYRLMLPPTEEQRRIVAKVEALLAHLDNAVTSLDRIKTNLKRYRASVLQAAVEGRLTADWRKQNPPKETSAELLARILKERRAKWEETQLKKYAEQGKTPPRNWKDKYPELVKPDTTGLPDLPEGWAWGTMDTVGEITGGLTKNQRRLSLPLQLPYLRVANVYLNELRLYDVGLIGLEEKELEKVLIRKGDLLIVEGNGSPDQIGRLAIWDGSIEKCVHQNHLIKVRLYENLQPKLAVLWFSSAAGRKCITEVSSSTSGLYTLSVGKVGALPLPLPPLDEQEEIILEVESRLTIADAAEKTVDSALQRAARLRQSILKRAFEGRLVPQDPNDEPASALLERIRAERLKQAATLKPARAKSKLKSRQAETSIGEIGIKGAETA